MNVAQQSNTQAVSFSLAETEAQDHLNNPGKESRIDQPEAFERMLLLQETTRENVTPATGNNTLFFASKIEIQTTGLKSRPISFQKKHHVCGVV